MFEVSMLRLLVGVAVAILGAAIPWFAAAVRRPALGVVCGSTCLVIAAGVLFGLPLYPVSDLIVLGFAVSGGILLGRALPAEFIPFLLTLVVLSGLDLVQVALTSGPPPAAASASTGLNPHLIWVNFQIPLPEGHFNIGIADLLLIAAMGEHFRRRHSAYVVSLLPGVLGLVIAELFVNLPGTQGLPLGVALSQALIPFLTIGFAGAQVLAVRSSGRGRPNRGFPVLR
jgi:hypothetical protein